MVVAAQAVAAEEEVVEVGWVAAAEEEVVELLAWDLAETVAMAVMVAKVALATGEAMVGQAAKVGVVVVR